ncbi:MAG: TolC family protein [Athalassotoga sp.]|uniref:TolC family protein n=1 Tax=Athalassotoga sp. TaxID=2022597 RepID=UPI003CFFBC36
MKRLLIFILFVIPVYAFSMTLPQLFQSAQATNTTFHIATLSLEQASMTYQLNMIQASVPIVNQGGVISAQISYNTSLQAYQNNLKNYYSSLLNSAFGVEIAKINLEISQINLNVATMNYTSTLALFKQSMASTVSLQQASVTVATDQNNVKNASWNYDFALSNFKNMTGIDWDIDFTLPDLSSIPASRTMWISNDPNVTLAKLNLQNAKYNLEVTPSNASKYTLKVAQMQVEQASLNLQNAILNSQNNYSSAIQKLRYDYENALSAKANLDIAKNNLDFYTNAYNSGLISQSTYLSQYRIPYLNAELSYYNALQTYWNDLVSYLLSIGLRPEVIL